ncbi:GLPGLI family protein [Bacteroides neonati]|uniref:GLPGLI family protein n=1 Tax=Bacteroides neonati TaxID=1347393 RepID=UPI0004B727F8|nr:GLPGLI family protein [Bacteroides neonati]
MHKMIVMLVAIGISFVYGKAQQVLGEASLKCSYTHTYLKDTLNNIQSKDLLYLQIGKTLSKCYSYYTFQSDSLSQAKDGSEIRRQLLKKAIADAKGGIPQGGFPYKRMRTYVYKNYPQGKMTVTDGISTQDYIYEDELNAQNWQISDSVKTIMDYSCQKAVCNFRGRQWTAWFSTDIPISDGPWKFGGLPGLILEVYDKQKQYHYFINGLEKVEGEPIIFSKSNTGNKKFERTSRRDFLKAQKRYLLDIYGYIELETGIDLGKNNSQKVIQYDLIELDYK